MTATTFLTREDILAYHAADFLKRGLTPAPIISEEKFEAALTRPQTSVFGEDAYPVLSEKAAAYLQSFAIGHPFMDGNKRVATAAALLFLELNGVSRRVDMQGMLTLVLEVAKGEMREIDLIAARLRELFAPDLDGR